LRRDPIDTVSCHPPLGSWLLTWTFPACKRPTLIPTA